ncbi:hypothetical protein C8R45DRAFT_1135218, partial [Mycena sanguinolenta]
SMATPTPMPARGDRNAPQFDSTKPHELRRYFSDLEYLLTRAAVTNDQEKKRHATRFLSAEDQEIWEGLETFTDLTKSYDQFKAAVLKLYAGNNDERRFELIDLDSLIGHYSRVGILSIADLTTFYRQFLRITTYLIGKGRLSPIEQSRAFLRAMQPSSFELAILRRLEIKKPDVHPGDVHTLADLYEAAEFVLAGSAQSFLRSAPFAPAAHPLPIPAASPTQIEVKPDPGLAALVGQMSKLIDALVSQKLSTDGNGGPKRTRPDGCGYCSEPDHFINDCRNVLEDIKAGFVRRNSDGRVVLPSGAFVPKLITGKDLRTRVKKWHELNPGQIAAAQLFIGVEPVSAPITPSTVKTLTLTDEARLEMLQREIFAIRTRAQAKRALETRDHEEPDRTIPPTVHAPPASTSAPTATPTAPAPTPVPTASPNQPTNKGPQHPFSNARDAAYAPPTDRNVGLPPAQNKSGPAYRTAAPVHNPRDVSDVVESCLNAPVTLTQRQIWSIAPDVRSQLRDITTPRRTPSKDVQASKSDPPATLLHSTL